MRILMVDDDMSTRLLVTRFLTNWSMSTTASDGVEALEILNREGIQLVISDWLMPRMDGLELCQRIRAGTFPGYVYVIILTAKDSKGELITAMEAGADDYIAKPFDKNELNVRIRAGERVLNLEKDLEDRNERLTKAFSIMRKDLEAAAKMQKDLLPGPEQKSVRIFFRLDLPPVQFCRRGYLSIPGPGQRSSLLFLLDVSGHGVPAAMLSFTLTKTLTSLAFPGTR